MRSTQDTRRPVKRSTRSATAARTCALVERTGAGYLMLMVSATDARSMPTRASASAGVSGSGVDEKSLRNPAASDDADAVDLGCRAPGDLLDDRRTDRGDPAIGPQPGGRGPSER